MGDNFDDEFEKIMGFKCPGLDRNETKLNQVLNDTPSRPHAPDQETTQDLAIINEENFNADTSSSTDVEEYNQNDNFFDDPKRYDFNIPLSNVATMKHGSKIISAITCNSNGSRLVTGSHDYNLNFWDFHTMDKSLKSFRQFAPIDQHLIRNVAFSPENDLILVCASNCQAKLLDKDGKSVYECVKGDQYIVDMQHTKGHVSMTYNACWNPVNLNEFMTCSQDGTIRLWKNTDCPYQCKRIIKFRVKSGKPQPVTFCIYSHDGNISYAASNEGVIESFDLRKSSNFPALTITDCFSKGFECSCLSFDTSGYYIACRSTDDSMKLYDIRKFKSPLFTWNDLITSNDVTKCIFSPDNKLVITGTSSTKKQRDGYLLFFNTKTGEKVHEICYENSGVVSQLWHPKLNQIFVGCSNGDIHAYFDPQYSTNGIMKCITHVKRRTQYAGEVLIQPRVRLPFARSTKMADGPSYNKLKTKVQTDPVLSKRPELPVLGPGQGGRLTSTLTVSAYMCKQLGISKKDDGDDNPREAILKYAKLAEEQPYFVAPAYKKTQPIPVFQNSDESDSEDDPSQTSISGWLKSSDASTLDSTQPQKRTK